MIIEEQYSLLEKISIYSVIIPIFLSILKIKTLNKSLWVLVFYLIVCFLVDQLSLLLINSKNRANILSNSFTLIEYILISSIYYSNFSSRKSKLSIIIISSVFIFFSLLVFFVKGYYFVDTIVSPAESALITIFAGFYLTIFLINTDVTKPLRYYFYWINLAFFLYFSASTILFLSSDFLSRCTTKTFFLIWGIHLILNIIKNIFLSIGIWVKATTRQ